MLTTEIVRFDGTAILVDKSNGFLKRREFPDRETLKNYTRRHGIKVFLSFCHPAGHLSQDAIFQASQRERETSKRDASPLDTILMDIILTSGEALSVEDFYVRLNRIQMKTGINKIRNTLKLLRLSGRVEIKYLGRGRKAVFTASRSEEVKNGKNSEVLPEQEVEGEENPK